MVVAFGLVAVCFFALGVLADRFLFYPRDLQVANAPASQPAAHVIKHQEQQTSTVNPVAPAQSASAPPREPSLTFYETLSKGGKVILGSGINPKQPAAQNASPARTTADAPPRNDQIQPRPPESGAVQKTEKPVLPHPPKDGGATADGTGRQKGSGEASREATSPAIKGKFAIQVASARERKEAEAIKSALQEKGFAAYIVESTVAGKGTWYRVKVGKQMDQSAAANLAKQLGKAAIIISE